MNDRSPIPAILLIVVGLAAGQCAAAQTPATALLKAFSIGPYAEVDYPAGKMADTHGTGWGLGLAVDLRLPLPIALTGSIGYNHFGGKAIPGSVTDNPALNAFPLRVGIRWSKGPFYTAIETGTVSVSKGSTSGLLAPAIGFHFLRFDIRGKYETWFRDGAAQFWGVQGSIRF